MMVAYSVSTPLTLGRGVSYKDGSIRAGSQRVKYFINQNSPLYDDGDYDGDGYVL